MEPVLDELRPLMKVIMDKIFSLALQKTPRTKEDPSRLELKKKTSPIVLPLGDSFGGKAEKTVYLVLVREAANLFKTPQLCLRKASFTISFGLHGCSRDNASEMLNKGLRNWVDCAMKREYQFVIPVGIVCGGGNQVLLYLSLASFVIIPKLQMYQAI